MRTIMKLWRDETGVTSVEYALLVALITAASVAAWNRLADTVGNMVIDASTQIANGS
ncbi:MAG: Flp family type IVb pilin [Armatimonadetes bacterium]|nr:Flp family type IVb pilin [Armatimonadota bacterium]